jgi:hypothetical protein
MSLVQTLPNLELKKNSANNFNLFLYWPAIFNYYGSTSFIFSWNPKI